ncbi:oxidoreductase [Mixta intestinalis]|uniref:Scyllo-inositol 2-dehydrogenase (NADP(+)) n=1 Tax=Mixta intestinalis TaxID=1615494 RepID=A0A6P1PVW1_9GAMM|nr:oxidoreductase [Mixta intestinalis]QHM70202.1 scyllo-inositol 2-dehydrogenase (NADP(+)) [Mixta intestinalis]
MSDIATSGKTINVALIGYGFAGKTFHAPLLSAVPEINLYAIVSSDAAKVHADFPQMQVFAEPQQAIAHPEIDLIVIASPNTTHAPLARQALEAGKHVVVDKPFTLDMQEARELIALAQEKGLLLSVFHNRRWDSDYLGVRQAIEQGAVGKVAQFESHIDRFRPQVRVRWREQNVPGSGLWFDLGPHLIDQALQLFGLPESVQGNIATLREKAEVNDWAHVVLNYPAHRAILHCSMLAAGGVSRFSVHGSKGSLIKARIDQQESQLLAGVMPGSEGWGVDEDAMTLYSGEEAPRQLPTPAGDQGQYYRQIARALNGQQQNPVPPLQALAVMAVLEAAVKASASGQAQRPELSAEEKAALRFPQIQ